MCAYRMCRLQVSVKPPAKFFSATKDFFNAKIRLRTRKLKCDQGLPHCLRCMSTGWKCEYVEPPPIRRKKLIKYQTAPPILSIYRGPPPASEDIENGRSFYYFRTCALQQMSGFFGVGFWERYVLQVSDSEPSVRYALLALSCLCESKASEGPAKSDSSGLEGALMHYSKAIRLLATDLASHQPSREVILISCLIFVSFEFVRNNHDTGLNHLHAGLQILEDSQASRKSPSIDASIPQLFLRLRIQARLHGSPTSNFNFKSSSSYPNSHIALPASFTNLDHARSSLDTISDAQYLFHRQLYDPERSPCEVFHLASAPEQHWLTSARVQHLQRLQNWQVAFENTTSLSLSMLDGTKAMVGSLLLQIHQIAAYIMMQPVFEDSELAFDELTSQFEDLVSLADHLIHKSGWIWINAKVIYLDIGIILPLFLVAIKCRQPTIRRRAVALLKKAPEREGIWVRTDCLSHAEWKISAEEQGHKESMAKGGVLPVSARICGERPKQTVIAGQLVTVMTFRRGGGNIESEITNFGAAMGAVC